MERVEYEGKVHLRMDGEWLTADFQTPPKVIVRELKRLYGREKEGATEKKSRQKASVRPSLSIQAQVAPEIVDVIRRRFEETGEFVTRGEIVEGLVERPHIRDLLYEAYEKQAGFDSFEEYVGNQVDFFSKGITEGVGEFVGMFERVKVNDKWAYRPIGES